MKREVIAVIQVRMGSTRLPGKALKEVLGRPLLAYLVQRVQGAAFIDKILIATTDNPVDDAIVDFCGAYSLECFRGSENDVLERFAKAIEKQKAEIIVRICGDCPLIDARVIDKVIQYYTDNYPVYDYVSNTLIRSYPRGMDVEVFSKKSLFKSAKEATKHSEREHVTPYIYRNENLFKIASVQHVLDTSSIRLTVDTQEDFLLISKILEKLFPENEEFGFEDIVSLLRKNPDWLEINANIKQKEVL